MSGSGLLGRATGEALRRLDGPAKAAGLAPYAFERPVAKAAYLYALQAPVARGRIMGIDGGPALERPGVLAVLTHENAFTLADTDDRELAILQSDQVAFRGEIVGAVIAEESEIAREAAGLVVIDYLQELHDADFHAGRPDFYKPEKVNPSFPTDTEQGDVEAAMAAAAITVDETYTTPRVHNNPMEPHTTVAIWSDGGVTVYDSTQHVHGVREKIATLFGLDAEKVHVSAPHVGGGFGSKGTIHSHVVLAVMAARLLPGHAVKLALTRQQMFALVGYRTPTIQRVRLAADSDGHLLAIAHDVIEQTSKIKEFAEQTAVCTRMMYAAPNRVTTHRLAALDVSVPSWMRAPGECPGMFAPEVALDELAVRCAVDPVELRIRNEPDVDPDSGKPWSSRGLVECLREGARRFGWEDRDPRPATRTSDGWLIGSGVASSVYPVYRQRSTATIAFTEDQRYAVRIAAIDIGTGSWTSLTQIAADALEVEVESIELGIGDTAYPFGSVAGGSSGTTTWGSAIVAAARAFRKEHGLTPAPGDECTADAPKNDDAERFAMYAFGAQFAEVGVRADTGEIRVPRLIGVFGAGRIINPLTARSQFIGGMTMGLSMALHEHSVLDPRYGHVVNHDFAEYHIASHADVPSIEVAWIDEHDEHVNAMGSKGIGELGIVGTAAAIANAAWHATGLRIRDLPITPDKLLGATAA